MKRFLLTSLFIATALAMTGAVALAEKSPAASVEASTERPSAPRNVRSASFSWRDADRCRTVPATIYYPVGDDTGLPVVLFSHGLGRSRDACAYLGQHWARAGYVSVHVEHYGSNEAVWRGTLRARQELRAAFYSHSNRRNRPLDISFAIDRLAELEETGDPLGVRLDLGRIGAIGHDFGAQTSLMLAGEMLPGGQSYLDPRITAVVAMSTPVPSGGRSFSDVFGEIRVPCLHVTGTRDDSVVATTRASQRRIPFDNMSTGDQFLVTFYGADHLIYAGHPLPRRNRDRNDGVYQHRLRVLTTLFWDAYLKQVGPARDAITNGGLADAAGRIARVEQKAGVDGVTPVSRSRDTAE